MSKSNECPECSAIIPQQTRRCPACGTLIAKLKREVRASRERRYVYGRRKQKLSQEAIWVIVVIILGILIVITSQLIAFMRARKLVQLPGLTTLVWVMGYQPVTSSAEASTVISMTPAPTSPFVCLPLPRQVKIAASVPIFEGMAVCNYLPSRQYPTIGSYHRRNGKT